jgi:hypothetical protein
MEKKNPLTFLPRGSRLAVIDFSTVCDSILHEDHKSRDFIPIGLGQQAICR